MARFYGTVQGGRGQAGSGSSKLLYKEPSIYDRLHTSYDDTCPELEKIIEDALKRDEHVLQCNPFVRLKPFIRKTKRKEIGHHWRKTHDP